MTGSFDGMNRIRRDLKPGGGFSHGDDWSGVIRDDSSISPSSRMTPTISKGGTELRPSFHLVVYHYCSGTVAYKISLHPILFSFVLNSPLTYASK